MNMHTENKKICEKVLEKQDDFIIKLWEKRQLLEFEKYEKLLKPVYIPKFKIPLTKLYICKCINGIKISKNSENIKFNLGGE